MGDQGKELRLIAMAKSGWVWLHEKTGLPWWSTLVAGAVVIRAATFPLCLYGQYHADKLSSLAPELERIRAYVSRSSGTTVQKIRTFRRLRQELLKRSSSSSLKVVPYGKLVHIPLFITAAASVRRLAFQRYPGFESEGISWFKDLAAPDPWYILPIVNSAILIANTENSLKANEKPSLNSSKRSLGDLANSLRDPQIVDWMKIILQGMTILVFPLISHLPSGVVFFWTVNSLLNALQQTLLIGKGKRYVGLYNRTELLAQSKGLADSLFHDINTSVEDARLQLSRIQKFVMEYSKEPVRMFQEFLLNERRSKRLSLPLSAEIRKDETTGKDYVAIVMASPDEEDSSSKA
ncbi:preprotein translocase, Oxa1 family isoform 1 [Galdieria sulphuraria]|uniref:Preprotein translocase, Oxa1 family isoform 1 n=1 Tax=Galdieria sulphuraria TaxID=130081 RepID=M2Y497_GALSU|nr:preprotein translocase, Oxa1 family isoform 1 [Galdieria sulphuraria]EME30773.1 preprotein translocase, Oxa1 family isoform 1 [Galdieria sulphuraria]|eukprot:XP_005707293.1 preprotein translocase, Oxa1 family isoform 1 [Galdieria sulphuraria]